MQLDSSDSIQGKSRTSILRYVIKSAILIGVIAILMVIERM